MPHLPEGLVVVGDALCNLNPLHGQGMTMAALQALALRDCLRTGHTDLPRRFYRLAAEQIEPVWAANRANDRASSAGARAVHAVDYAAGSNTRALHAATNDIFVAERLFRVRGMIDPPAHLQDPALLLRILLANVRRPRQKSHPAVRPIAHRLFRQEDAATCWFHDEPAGETGHPRCWNRRIARPVGRVSELDHRTHDDEQRRTLVPATPRWTVHELLAHLVGVAADAAGEAAGRSHERSVDSAPRRGTTAQLG